MQEGIRLGQATQEAMTADSFGERRLWMAVIMQAVDEWRSGSLRNRRKAQEFIFGEDRDFSTVCANAGLDADSLKSRLLRIADLVPANGGLPQAVLLA